MTASPAPGARTYSRQADRSQPGVMVDCPHERDDAR